MQGPILSSSDILNPYEDILDQIANASVVRLNFGCGIGKIPGYINIDINCEVEPDLALDIRKGCPFPKECADEILFFHTIEHIEEKYHPQVLFEFWRLLKPNGVLYVSYPEFTKVAQNYINNHLGLREFWKHTIYGLQRSASDFHVALMDTKYFVDVLQTVGFKDIEYKEEFDEPFNTVVRAVKGSLLPNYEELLVKDLGLWVDKEQ